VGSTNSVEVFVKRIEAKANAVGDAPRVGARAAALIVKTSVLTEFERIAPGLRMSGLRGKSKKIGVRYIDGINAEGRATVLVAATGPVQLIERDTSPHDILPRGLSAKTARGRAAGKKALAGVAGGSHQFGPVTHVHSRGTHGQHPFEKGVDIARPLTGAAMRLALHQALAKEIL
jgi:hypothetical protein